MIEIKIKHRNCRMHLVIKDKVTVIMGLSATGKSTIHRVLTNPDSTTDIKLSNSKFELINITSRQSLDSNLNKDNTLFRNKVYVIDEGKLSIDDAVANIIQYSINVYFIITARTKLGKLNYGLTAVKKLEQQENGISILKDFIRTTPKNDNELRVMDIDKAIIEDSGKAKTWFMELFKHTGIDLKSPEKMGKEQVCSELKGLLEESSHNVLAIFDECSFGVCVKEFRGIIEEFSGRIIILSNYKSWEYVMLQSNMYKDDFAEYSIEQPMFEEAYYEELLQKLSKDNRYTVINHDSGSKLSDCYIKPCCWRSQSESSVCTRGVCGDDKFVALLKGTLFHGLLIISGRL